MRINNLNSYLLILIIYKDPLSLIFPFYFSPLQIKMALLVLIIVLALLFNRIKFNSKFVIIYLVLISMLLLNMLLVQYKQYVIADSINILLVTFVPLYIFTLGKYDFGNFKNAWYKIAVYFTLLLPLYYLYLDKGYINYMDFGYLTHINSIIFIYSFFKTNKNRRILLVLILLNFFLGLIFGSRMIMMATLVVFLFSVYILQKKTFKGLLRTSIITIVLVLIFTNIINILEFMMSEMQARGIRSRNISLFYNYLTADTKEGVYLSGREGIYPIISEHLGNNGFFPSGLSVARFLTNGVYYHSHSFYLEFPLVFGYILSTLILIYLFYKFVIFYKIEKNDGFNIIVLMLISFLSRSVTGTYFVNDSFFIIIVMLLISIKKKDDNYTGSTLCQKEKL